MYQVLRLVLVQHNTKVLNASVYGLLDIFKDQFVVINVEAKGTIRAFIKRIKTLQSVLMSEMCRPSLGSVRYKLVATTEGILPKQWPR
ncbi:hypothetical protein [Parasitella parasitica]|uniref:Uncharacterized protein n=1 Tax=Parasitella parasitica TaxID=35722 RepID=A0A0B7N158_9FUNG|nr:hypothetical protein [Parasitella parasitica]